MRGSSVPMCTSGGSLTPIGDPLQLNERPYIAIGADLVSGTAEIWAHAPTLGGELFGYGGSGTTLTAPESIAPSGSSETSTRAAVP